MKSYVVTANRSRQIERMLAFKDGAENVEFDFSPWVDDNATVTAVTWTVQYGQASVSSEALASNVASALITTSEAGASLIRLKATGGNNIYTAYLYVFCKDPQAIVQDDYGLCYG